MKTENLKFPVFTFSKDEDNMIYVHFDKRSYSLASMSIYKNEDFYKD
jgi:hypothetical protein